MAITAIYWFDRDGDGSWVENRRYVVPMQHTFENPIQADSGDTFIQFWIDNDDRLSRDFNEGVYEKVLKVADVRLRFIGACGEQWAKAFHHFTHRGVVWDILQDFCNAEMLEYVKPIVPINVDYFSANNAAIAFETGFVLKYYEYMDLSDLRKPLEFISLGPGKIREEEK
jgi:hypothetical protein